MRNFRARHRSPPPSAQLESTLAVRRKGNSQDIRCAGGDDLRHPHHVRPAVAAGVGLIDRQQRLVVSLPQQGFIEANAVPADEIWRRLDSTDAF